MIAASAAVGALSAPDFPPQDHVQEDVLSHIHAYASRLSSAADPDLHTILESTEFKKAVGTYAGCSDALGAHSSAEEILDWCVCSPITIVVFFFFARVLSVSSCFSLFRMRQHCRLFRLHHTHTQHHALAPCSLRAVCTAQYGTKSYAFMAWRAVQCQRATVLHILLRPSDVLSCGPTRTSAPPGLTEKWPSRSSFTTLPLTRHPIG